MAFGTPATTYVIELWSSAGSLLGDISKLTQNREYILTRNDAEQFTFDLDLTAFEQYCASINESPLAMLAPYQTDVKVKRNGVYIFGCQVVGITFNFQPNDSGVNPETSTYNNITTLTETVTVSCTGYLNLFADRYILSQVYANADPCYIAKDMINQSQALTNGNVGVTINGSSYMTGAAISPTLTQQNIKEELQTLTTLVGSNFDFGFDYNKVFTTYQMIGSVRNDITLVYGGPGSNVTGLYHQRTASGTLLNEIIGLGSGFGADQLSCVLDNTTSQVDYYLRQDIKQYSNVTDQPTLNAYTAADLAIESSILEIPQIIITGKALVGLPFLNAGDRLPLSFPTHPFLANLNGQYFRIEQMDVKLDDNDFEYEIAITFDNYGLNID